MGLFSRKKQKEQEPLEARLEVGEGIEKKEESRR